MPAAPFSTTILKNLLFVPHLHSTMNPFSTPVSSAFFCLLYTVFLLHFFANMICQSYHLSPQHTTYLTLNLLLQTAQTKGFNFRFLRRRKKIWPWTG